MKGGHAALHERFIFSRYNGTYSHMQLYSDNPKRRAFIALQPRHFRVAILLGVSFLVVMWLSERFIPHPATLFPASAIALSVLFLQGIEFWPVVYLTALIGYLLLGVQPVFIIILPIAQALQAVVGAYLLRKAQIDPLLRRSRHIFLLTAILLVVSLIVPSITSFADALNTMATSIPSTAVPWLLRYIGTFFCLLIFTPFLLRWLAKPRFSRTPIEAIETISVFALLIIIDFFLFLEGVAVLGGIPVVYFMLVPLFWIALRLRPRFITLALLITSLFAICGLYFGPMPLGAELFTSRLYQIEELLIVLAAIFLIITTLEEDRRLNSNLMHSQMATLENAVARISSESNAKNDFIAILGHELRNPLAPIVSGIDFLKLKNSGNPEETETLVMMEERMRTVRRLLDDLLDISRITEGKIALKKEVISLQTIIRRSIISTTHLIKERHQALNFKAPKERLFIEGDPVRIEQVFSNLITNSSKYSDAGEQITITMRKRDDQAEIVVSDMGVGIETDLLDKIFTPFHQVDSGARSKKGLGIGLALVRSFVEMHKGSIVATSEGSGKGSQFTLLFPLIEDDGSTDASEETARRVASSERADQVRDEKKSDGPRVLVVDDNDAAASGMGRLLELKGCTVFYAYNGKQAIEEAMNTSPDIILLDIGLPDQDGYTVAKTIRARGFRGRLIALTGFSNEDARLKGRDAGFEHYLVKPAGFADLKRVIPEIA